MPPSKPKKHADDDAIIHTEQLTITFGEQVGVENVNLDVARGQTLGFIGPSGSGKTTAVRLLTGIYEPTAGTANVFGTAPRSFTRPIREKIGYMPQLFALYPELTVWENLNFAASIYGVSYKRQPRLNELLEFVDLSEHKGKLARNLSGGMQRRLSLAATLVHSPELIFLDEPTAGIDPVLRRKFWDHFKALQREGRTMFVTTQYVGEAAYCDLVGVMVKGRLVALETPDGLRRRAFGGEAVDMVTKERLVHKDLGRLRRLPFVKGKVTRLENGNGVRLIVEESSTAIPALLEWCRQEYVPVESIEPYLPPYDDVFVELVKDVTQRE
jgi:ABC-2 type transport system ATP-binding protein